MLDEVRGVEPSRVEPVPEAGPVSRFEEISLADVLRFGRRHGPAVLTGGLLAAVATVLLVVFVIPADYTARATLVVVPAAFSAERGTLDLGVQGYQTLLESDAVVAETRDYLLQAGLLEEDEEFGLGDGLASRIFVSRRQDTASLSPMIELMTTDDDPETAAAAANKWAENFLSRAKMIGVSATQASLEAIERRHPEALSDLEQLEARWLETAERLQNELDEAVLTWDSRIASQRKKTAELLGDYQAETRTRMLDLLSSEVLDNVEPLPPDLQRALINLVTLRVQLAQSVPVVPLEKAMTDDAIWQSFISNNQTRLKGRSLITEELNPSYSELLMSAVELETELATLGDARSNLLITRFATLLEQEQRRRASGLAKLHEDRDLNLNELYRKRDAEIAGIERRKEIELTQLTRRIADQKQLESRLATSHNQALMADAREDVGSVWLAAPAVPPAQPDPRYLLLKAALAAVVGGACGLFVSMARASAA